MKTLIQVFFFFLICPMTVLKAEVATTEGYIPVQGGNLFFTGIGEGEPLVLVHGGPGLDHSYFLPQMELLAKKYKLIFYDQRACGKSSVNVGTETLNMNQFVEDLEALRKFFKLEKMNLLGHSFGGLIAMRYAIKYPENLKTLLLINSSAATSAWRDSSFSMMVKRNDPETTAISEALMKTDAFKKRDPDTMAYFFRLLFKKSFYFQEKVEELTLKFQPSYPETSLLMNHLYNDSSLISYDLNSDLKKLKMPVLILATEADIISPVAVSELHENIKTSKYVFIEECGHFPFIEQPQLFLNAIDRFFGKKQE
ncbi:MAG: alpha/beta fold hydrolase [Bacteroidetes bacterium]|nr:MAG: alpha/beta fold hydrolase [Bacteroidota bacterium]